MRTPLISFLFLLSNALYASSVPLPLTLKLPAHPNKAEVDNLKAAEALANKHIDAMHKVAHNAHLPENHEILKNTFGENYNIKAIQHHVETLRTGTVEIKHVSDLSLPSGVRAKTDNSGQPDASIRFGPDYHDPRMTDHGKAGTLIHEASHALLGTKDFWSADKTKSIPKSEYRKDPTSAISGYMADGQYDKLKDKDYNGMHMNADTWKGFGYHAYEGKPHPNLSVKPAPAPVAPPAHSP